VQRRRDLQEFDRLSRGGEKIGLRGRILDGQQLPFDLGQFGLPRSVPFGPERSSIFPSSLSS
jgi:hypothetical protein